jgi:hypothetical protein
MKLSIVIPVLDSHEVFRRQCRHWEQIGIPDDTEILIVDDDSDPPLEYHGPLPLRIIQTHDPRPWAWAPARNMGARAARGEYLLMYDLDHFCNRDLIDFIRGFNGDKVQFLRQFAVLREDGTFAQDVPTLVDYGWPASRLERKGFSIPPHPNMFAMKADVFWDLGGYREDWVGRPYPQGEDSDFKRKWHKARVAGVYDVCEYRPVIYVFPCGKLVGHDVDYDKKGLFHKLTRAVESNPYHARYKREGLVK